MFFGPEKHDTIYNRIRYLIAFESNIIYVVSHNYAKIEVDSYDSLLLNESLTFHNVLIHIKSACNKDQNPYFYNTFLEKCSYQLAKK